MLQQRSLVIVDSGQEIVCDMYSNSDIVEILTTGCQMYLQSKAQNVPTSLVCKVYTAFKMHILIHLICCSDVLQMFFVALLTIYYDTVSLVPLLFSHPIFIDIILTLTVDSLQSPIGGGGTGS